MFFMNLGEIFHYITFFKIVSEHDEEDEFKFQEALRALAPKNVHLQHKPYRPTFNQTHSALKLEK